RRWGAPRRAGVLLLVVFDCRPLRTSCEMVGMSSTTLPGRLFRAREEAGLVFADARYGLALAVARADVGQPGGQILIGVGRVVRQRFVVGRLEVEIAVAGHARAGRDQLPDDDVLLEAEELVALALDGGLGEHTRGLLERRRRQPRVGGQRRLGDAHELGPALGRRLAVLHQFAVDVGVLAGV